MPVPMKSAANRLGKLSGVAVSAKAESDSSHGNAIVTPAPRSTARREMRFEDSCVGRGISVTLLLEIGLFDQIGISPVQKLGTRHEGLDEHGKPVAITDEPGFHPLNERFIGELERPAQSIAEQFPAEIIEKILLPVLADIMLHAFKPGGRPAVRELHLG